MIIKSIANCQAPSLRKHIKFMMALTVVPFQVCFAIIGPNPVYLTLFILYGQYYNDLLFFWFHYFTYMEVLRIVLWIEGVFNFFY